ncbi:polyphenol oxidase family protein [Aquipuribacter nitratireducens]|uniref:Polyphenol oxidase family protein n=1 Tax=Aquipuribacter nitratireducens TaxID=650104 RepID=A0ABW0GQG8_9MICO
MSATPGVLHDEVALGAVRLVLTGDVDLGRVDDGAGRTSVARALGVPTERLLLPTQVHGDRVVEATGPWPGPAPEADAVLVRGDRLEAPLAVGVRAADCMPLLLADPDAGVAAAVHVGRRGLQLGIARRAVRALRAAGARRVVARAGPTVCGRCYEVPDALRAEVATAVPEAAATTRIGTPAVDIVAGVRAQLARPADPVLDGGPVALDLAWCRCTLESPDLASHRRDATPRRHAAVVVVDPA